MHPPEGYKKASPGQLCHLKRSLYGLKQPSRQWNTELCLKLLAYGFTQSVHDHCLFFLHSGHSFLILVVYVDDVLISGSDEGGIAAVKSYLDRLFTIKDLGYAKYFLGIELARGDKGLFLNQRKYVLDIVQDAGMLDCKPASTPLPPGLKLVAQQGDPLPTPDKYRRLIGRLLYLNMTRPDLTYVVQQLSQFVNSPHSSHWDADVHAIRYLKGNPSKGLFYPASSSSCLEAYSDADWGACLDTRKSLTGYCVFLGQSLIAWKTKKQVTISRSPAEAEYRALGNTVCELQWLSYLLHDLQVPFTTPITFWCDNQAALHIVENPVFHERTKHLEIDCHLVRNKFKDGFVLPKKISSSLQLADFFTKSLGVAAIVKFISKLGIVDLHQSPA
ncbi:hypothetical protein DH2020_048345 [Rehmannia glutinosa]|uniref:Reverse transcriptase Ty1/copia-type domain-containing protein n=1 Tax=Rehmannia glutinosa TaxID=99300 RepID=A0ABR0U5W1_REHGL